MNTEHDRPDPTRIDLTPHMYHVLIALGDGVLHGLGIIRTFEELTGGRETLLPGSLYATLARMVELELLAEAEPPAGEHSGGPSRRYYRVTALGREAVKNESRRRARLLELARRRFAFQGGA